MFIVREWKSFIADLCADKWKLLGWFCLLILTILSLIKSARLEDVKGTISIADAMDQFFSVYTFVFPVIPLLLLFIAIGLLPFFSLFRVIRYKSRAELFLAFVGRIFGISSCFTFVFLLFGFIISVIWCGGFVHNWDTTNGTPYLLYGEQLQVTIFSPIWMIFRYITTAFLVFSFFITCTSAFYLIFSKYIYSFISIICLLMMDKMSNTFFNISILHDYLSLELTQWLVPGSFESTVFLYLGGTILLLCAIYIGMITKDFSNGTIDINKRK
ncbi:hypothetical protein [Bacillus inaquosorum]|uniref:hypothetical protein n=1 Tax=Bacillus inaquosorum TaxID=483913 RepID=UPI002281409B|nr:hypothetical protein [Bacillus inaquosorum]MCY8850592.1 hypothetical protein [Bacillus inaquosorum]MCY8870203.1 hypothetical protein [Bacillus inaquosorum]MCY9064934.1 hypothetical protein [Bacillus inaquosorum]